MNCGLPRMGYPCVGSWVTYGLGSESDSLPAFVVMSDPKDAACLGTCGNWGAGFLPSVYQGTHFRPTGDPIDNLKRPTGMNAEQQRRQLDLLKTLNQQHFEVNPFEESLAARIESLSWPTACRAPRPRRWRWIRNRSTFAPCTGWTTTNANTSPPNALRPAVWWSAACGSFRFTAGHGKPAKLGRPQRHRRQPFAVRR